MPHSTIRRGSSARRWSEEDRLLAVALTIYEAEQTRHGLPARIVLDDELGSWIKIDDSLTDYAEAALAAYREQHKDIPPGTILRPVMDAGAPTEVPVRDNPDRTLGALDARAGEDAPLC